MTDDPNDWQNRRDFRTTPGAPLADPSKNLTGPSNLVDGSKNLTGPSNLVTGKPSFTSQPEWDAHFKPSTALADALTPRGLQLPPSRLTPQQGQSLQQLASGGSNHQQAWEAGQRAPQANQASFVPGYLKRPEETLGPVEDGAMNLYGWGSAFNG